MGCDAPCPVVDGRLGSGAGDRGRSGRHPRADPSRGWGADGRQSRARAPGVASPVRHRSPRRTSVTPNHAAPGARGSAGPGKPPGAESAPHGQAPISPAAAARLQAEGHQLLGQGRYAGAVGHLRVALAATGQSFNGCTEPVSQACLTYAYALYDLGRALRLDGRLTQAVPVLTERLRIDNQRPTVQYELDLARQQLQETR